MEGTILVGTAGQGIVRSADNGATWHRLGLKEAIEFDGTVRSLAVDPADSARIYAGADVGICLSTDGGVHFERLDSPLNDMTVWALAIDPSDSNIVYAGTGAPSRAAMFRSDDGGKHWKRLPPELPEYCKGVNRPRILTICVDPTDTRQVWFGVEEGGVWRSDNRGDTFTRVDSEGGAIANSDIHAVSIVPGDGDVPKTTMVLSVNTVYTSIDDGITWTGVPSKTRFDGMYYTRTVQPLGDGEQALMLAIGDGTPGTRSKLYRSTDRGASWTPATLHTQPNSTFWAFGVHASEPTLVFAGTKYGHLFRSMDAGKSWFKEWRDFSEITAVAWTPYKAAIVAHPQSID
ncbi:glycosyl hydrolase [Pusillimonas sp. TS35]|uniref:WD40/YVTN/BNR-like repeat-containing protein n=1 Tax=Paracandidimonas lactea TaxID=2895524 RepID=UPI001369E1EC|nr:sialidase family protein [Paracandidimonas lactea]MYN14428.1 glycosyl hydrolase [Pusillimonas sp. TS35]